jgi:outer membrane receptor protein involved in Fe transport
MYVMKKISHLLLLALLYGLQLLTVHPAKAQTTNPTGEFQGKILDETGQAFPYASITLLNAKDSTLIKGTVSTDNGTYSLNKITPGSYLIAFFVVGYKKITKGPYSINQNQPLHQLGDIQLAQDSRLLKGVEIIKQKPLIERQIDKTVINVENSALATGNTALEILQKSPGVSVDKDGKISLRGKQGVNVMLDGKPTYLSEDQLANLLRSTEGSAIQTIELITNPSAKYDASGNSGIINIKFKKNKSYGTNGSVFAGAGMGKYYKVNSGFSLNHREKKFNLFGNFNYGHNKRFGGTDIMRVNSTSSNPTYFDQTSNTKRARNNSNYKAGLDYFINDKNTVGFSLNGYNSNGKNDAHVLTLISDRPGQTDSSVVASNPNDYKYTGISYNLNYKSTIDTLGQEFTMDADYSNYSGNERSNFNNKYLDATGQMLKPDYLFRNATPTKTHIWAAKADYTYPIDRSTKLETGIKSSLVKTDNNFLFENFEQGAWQNDHKRSNQFLYKENINAAYVNLSHKFKSTTLQLGLRAEQTNSNGNSITEQKVANRHYIDLFPSVFVNQELSKNNELGFSYSRRIDRPDYESLNPFVSYLDLYSYRFGNPFLKPQYTNAFELSYSYKKTLNMSIGYSRTTDVMTDVLLTDTISKTIFISNQNLATQDSYNLNISYPIQITKWWNSNNTLTTYYTKFKTPNLLGSPFESGKLTFKFNSTQTVNIDRNTSLECSANYESKQAIGTLLIDPQANIDLGLKKTILNKKMDIKFAATDVFNMQKNTITSALPSQRYTIKEKWESRVFRITCTYKFGSNDIKSSQKRSKSSESEESRVKSGG